MEPRLTKREAVSHFQKEILPQLTKRERRYPQPIWAEWCETLCRDGMISHRQHQLWGYRLPLF